MLKLKVMLAVKTYLSTRTVSFNTKPEVEVYRLANNAGVMLYGERKRSRKRLKARQLMYQKVQQLPQLASDRKLMKNGA